MIENGSQSRASVWDQFRVPLGQLAALPRRAYKTLSGLLDTRAFVRGRPGTCARHGDPIWLDEVSWYRSRVVLTGWAEASTIICRFGAQERHSFDLPMGSPTAANRVRRFEVEIPRLVQNSPLEVWSGNTPNALPITLQPPLRYLEFLVRLSRLPEAICLILRRRKDIFQLIGTGDPNIGLSLRQAFGLGETGATAPLISDDLFARQDRTGPRPPFKTVVVVPVFNAADDLAGLLARLPMSVDIDHHLLFINDGSDDPRVEVLLKDFVQNNNGSSTVLTLKRNSGFVSAANHGLAAARNLGHHVILLNTDTLPPDNWASRLIAPILSDTNVASVTPVSNSAEIASIPAQGISSDLSTKFVNTIDQVARRFASGTALVKIPTGIGFAMAMNRRFLDKIGSFDTAFGRGYGEEVDWCQRAAKIGGRHVLAANVFIGHKGGASFQSVEKETNLRASAAIIRQRYPRYDRAVQEWANDAPHGQQRLALALAWLETQSSKPIPIFIGHTLGGGAQMCLQREIDRALRNGSPGVVVLRVGGASRWQIEIQGRGFALAGRVNNTSLVHQLLHPIQRRKVIYSCGVGVRDPLDVPNMLRDLTEQGDHTLEFRVHDYFAISPSYCLLDRDGHYRGVSALSEADLTSRPSFTGHRISTDLDDWRRRWSALVDRTSRITVFSRSSAEIFASAYPKARPKTVVRPHVLPADMPTPARTGGANIGILGAINRAKGANVLVELAGHLNRSRNGRRLVLVGELDPSFRLPEPHRVLGKYKRADITELAERHGIGLWLMPSIWPETFSFATREALATGLPVLTFKLGAQAEAAEAAPNGYVLKSGPENVTKIIGEIDVVFDGHETPRAIPVPDLLRIA